ncbi:hypothetical protein JOC55_000714 [Paenibacillus sacheonensis]|nr:hypothetical protein [Paenibacillus sacheonensis]
MERTSLQLIDPPIGGGLYADEPGIVQDAQMLGNLRLLEVQSIGNIAHRQGPMAQQFDDVQSMWLGKSG